AGALLRFELLLDEAQGFHLDGHVAGVGFDVDVSDGRRVRIVLIVDRRLFVATCGWLRCSGGSGWSLRARRCHPAVAGCATRIAALGGATRAARARRTLIRARLTGLCEIELQVDLAHGLQLCKWRQLVERAQAEVIEEIPGRAEQLGAAWHVPRSDDA